MDTGDQSTAAVPPEGNKPTHASGKPNTTTSRRGRRSKLSEAVSSIVQAVTEGGGRAIT